MMNEFAKLSSIFSRCRRPSLSEFMNIKSMIESGCRLKSREVIKESSILTEFFLYNATQSIWDQIETEIEHGADEGIVYLYPSHPDYPVEYYLMEDLPFFLSYLGFPAWKNNCNFAVVGSREPNRQSLLWCDRVLNEICQKVQLCLVSGGARGIDQCVHQVAIRNQVPTLIFLPSGLLKKYPSQIEKISSNIYETKSAYVSEYLPYTEIKKHFFQQRNRLISGISFATLVVEAKRKSGTLVTAKKTIEQNKPLFVVPSHPLDINNQGGLDLMLEGATPVVNAENLISYIHAELKTMYFPETDIVANKMIKH